LTGDEVKKIVKQRFIKVDGKVRTDPTFPAGFMGEFSNIFHFISLVFERVFVDFQRYNCSSMWQCAVMIVLIAECIPIHFP
jgi:hypothetical protein